MKLLKILFLLTLVFTISCKDKKATEAENTAEVKKLPNIVVIYSDDLGYGDISANGATEISTPNIDKLANGGVRFTNGYATSATCTPSRYGLLTGVYPWRNKQAKILPGTAPLIISTEQTTIPKMLKTKGYHTGIVGKWHLGLGTGVVDWNKKITPSPNEIGFDYSFIMAATQDRVPTVYIKDGHVVNLDPNDPLEVNYKKNFKGEPTGKDNPELTTLKWHHGHNSSIVNGIPRIGYMKGGESAKWQDTTMAETFLNKAQDYVKQHKNNPFFLYYALRQPHVPRTPSPKFVGKSGMGPRGDVILEADWCIGEFMKTLEDEGLLENTLIIFSSDNGPVLNDGYFDDAVEKLGKHTPTGGLRGGKYSLFEAGTKVPFITYWKGKIQPSVSNALICHLDLLSSLAKLVDSDIKTTDSKEFLDAFMGKSKTARKDLVLEANAKTAYRNGDWALIPPYKGAPVLKEVNIEIGNSSEYQLYNIKEDRAQQNNLAQSNPEKLAEMIAGYTAIRGKQVGEIKEVKLK